MCCMWMKLKRWYHTQTDEHHQYLVYRDKKIKWIVQKFFSAISLASFLLYEGYKVTIPVLMGKHCFKLH